MSIKVSSKFFYKHEKVNKTCSKIVLLIDPFTKHFIICLPCGRESHFGSWSLYPKLTAIFQGEAHTVVLIRMQSSLEAVYMLSEVQVLRGK